MVKVTDSVIDIGAVIESARNKKSGGIVAYIGLIRDNSKGKMVRGVEYTDADGQAEARINDIVREIKGKFPVNDVAFVHRAGKLNVGDNNVVIAISAGHRQEAFTACQFAIDSFKEKLPTSKKETYLGDCSCGSASGLL
jgi:molybdopterin synthase catalytic subunit